MENRPNAAMPENRKINTEEDYYIQYWSDEFGISKEELEKAVQSGETTAEAVKKYVKKLVLVG